MKLRTTALAVALMASVSCLAVSAQAAPFGGWHGGWHGGGWHGGGWAGAGLGFAAGAIIGGALAAPYYGDGYYAAGYGYPDYGYAEAPVVYGYEYAPVDAAYGYGVAPGYGYAYGPAYTGYSVAVEPAWGYGQRHTNATAMSNATVTSVMVAVVPTRLTARRCGRDLRIPFVVNIGRELFGAKAEDPSTLIIRVVATIRATGTGVSRMNTGAGVGHMNAGPGDADRGRRH